jgi:hypothetical protein
MEARFNHDEQAGPGVQPRPSAGLEISIGTRERNGKIPFRAGRVE